MGRQKDTTTQSKWDQIASIAETQIGENYLTANEAKEFAVDDPSTVIFVATVEQDGTTSCHPVTETGSTQIVGFIKGHRTTVPEFTYNRFTVDMGPLSNAGDIFEVTTWAVTETYRGNGIGIKLINAMTTHIREFGVYPIVSPVRKVNNADSDNTAFNFLANFGTQIAVLDEKPAESVVCAKCGSSCSCQTVILSYTEEEIENLHTQTTELLSQ